MAYKKVVEALGEYPASVLELLKKWLEWFGHFKPLLDRFHQLRKEDLMGLIHGTHEIVRVREDEPIVVFRGISARVDLDAKPTWPEDFGIPEHFGFGNVDVQKRSPNDLYVNGKKVILYQSPKQTDGGDPIWGWEVLNELPKRVVLNATLHNFLQKNEDFIPEDWGADADGKVIYIYFLGTKFFRRDAEDQRVFLYKRAGKWHYSRGTLSRQWGANVYLARLED